MGDGPCIGSWLVLSVRVELAVRRRRLLVCQIEGGYRRQCAQQEDDVEPAVVEGELQVAQHLADDLPVLERHVHAHQQHARNKVHSLPIQRDHSLISPSPFITHGMIFVSLIHSSDYSYLSFLVSTVPVHDSIRILHLFNASSFSLEW